MKKREVIIIAIVCMMVAIGMAMGFAYLFGSTLMPYHFAYLGKTRDQLEPRTFDLLMMMKRVIGAHFLAISFGALILVGRFARGDVFVRWSVLVMVLISQVMLLYAGAVIQSGVLLRSLNVLEVVLVFFIFFLSRHPEPKEA